MRIDKNRYSLDISGGNIVRNKVKYLFFRVVVLAVLPVKLKYLFHSLKQMRSVL